MAEASKICCKQLDEKYHKMKELENYYKNGIEVDGLSTELMVSRKGG